MDIMKPTSKFRLTPLGKKETGFFQHFRLRRSASEQAVLDCLANVDRPRNMEQIHYGVSEVEQRWSISELSNVVKKLQWQGLIEKVGNLE